MVQGVRYLAQGHLSRGCGHGRMMFSHFVCHITLTGQRSNWPPVKSQRPKPAGNGCPTGYYILLFSQFNRRVIGYRVALSDPAAYLAIQNDLKSKSDEVRGCCRTTQDRFYADIPLEGAWCPSFLALPTFIPPLVEWHANGQRASANEVSEWNGDHFLFTALYELKRESSAETVVWLTLFNPVKLDVD